jgi:beta-xylosidase
MDVINMKDGDIAGLAVFQDPYAFIAVSQNKGSRFLVMVNNGQSVDSVAFKGSTIYLRMITSNSTGKATFGFSTDNKRFTTLGNELSMKFSLKIFTGNKFCLFNYATYETGGYVDFDWFRMQSGKLIN